MDTQLRFAGENVFSVAKRIGNLIVRGTLQSFPSGNSSSGGAIFDEAIANGIQIGFGGPAAVDAENEGAIGGASPPAGGSCGGRYNVTR